MALLEVRDLDMVFGGVHAVQGLSFEVAPGTVYSVIGPNGAGKTTLFNMVSGIYKPTRGRIFFDGEDITGKPPHALARRGLSRTFQNLQVCMNLGALENVMVGAHLKLSQRLLPAMLHAPWLAKADDACREEAARLMHFVGVGCYVHAHASSLPYGALKRMEI
ncbi:MAG: high-affinity branched-chain amino acid ABC transporter ATP-binding protein LivG, partial [Rhodocyclales bacterium CG17_big_fil_post_rev_8_21_14_2_50_68_7]